MVHVNVSPDADWDDEVSVRDTGILVDENTGVETMPNNVMLVIDGESGDADLERAMANTLNSLFVLFKKKQRSYGPGNIATFGELGCLIRAYDKVQRLKTLLYDKIKDPIEDETMIDTWMDLADYALIAIIVHCGKWPTVAREIPEVDFNG